MARYKESEVFEPRPKIAPARFAELLVNSYPQSLLGDLYDDLARNRLSLSDSNASLVLGVWFDDFTICVERLLEERGVKIERKLSENRLVPPGSVAKNLPIPDLPF